jgi:hypothetical protein
MARRNRIQLGNAKDVTVARAIYDDAQSIPRLQLTFKLESGEDYEVEMDYLPMIKFFGEVATIESVIFPVRRRR